MISFVVWARVGVRVRVIVKIFISLRLQVLLDLPLQSGGLSVRITCPYKQIALSPPKLVYPPGQFRIRSVFSTTGIAGAVTTRFHAES